MILSRRLGNLAPLTNDDVRFLAALKARTVPAGTVVFGAGLGFETPAFIQSGWSSRLSGEAAGKSQIVSLLLPGDGFGVGAAAWEGESLPVCTLTESVLLDASAVRHLVRLRSIRHARLVEACEKASRLEQRHVIDHIVRLGRQNACERVAHFVCELFARLGQAGLACGGGFCLPVKQQVLADVLGLSGVHFNRIARRMKQDGLISFLRHEVRILDLAGLQGLAGLPGAAETFIPDHGRVRQSCESRPHAATSIDVGASNIDRTRALGADPKGVAAT